MTDSVEDTAKRAGWLLGTTLSGSGPRTDVETALAISLGLHDRVVGLDQSRRDMRCHCNVHAAAGWPTAARQFSGGLPE